jgi:hypothetical protein
MALVLADRVQETSTTSGTGTLTLNGAVNGFQSFANGVGNGNTCYYTIYDTVAYTWEVGVGTYTTSGSTLTRTTVFSNSSQTTSLINFAGNLMNVWVDYPAEKAVSTDTLAYPPAIGATTPAAGTFTTFAVAGGLQNLFLQSQTFNTSPWGNTALTINQTATTAPDSTSTGNSLIPTAVSSIHRVAQAAPITAGVTYTASVYAKANGYNYLYFNCGAGFNGSTTFNISTGTVTNIGSGTATITSAGNGWYRCTITGTATATATGTLFIQVNSTQTLATDDTFTGDGTSGIYLWGAQVETSPTVHAYQVTTTAASSSNPKISLSGGGSLGLQSDGSLYVSPAGTGALQAQQTDSTATGGNARGTNAIDWQTSRATAAQVASGQYAVISGGVQNTASAYVSTLSGGNTNTASGNWSFVGGGFSNTSSKDNNVVVGGSTNTAAGYYNFIGGGYTNSGTSGSAVTTQSATMNATTAVTLAASNASIKVGQLITGTSIASYTYVAAISGTSLTLSQAASGSSTSTLSFYTPHGVVVGGGNNQATGAYSFIGGGGDAGTAANRNVASGDWSVVGGGRNNTASGAGSFIGGGGYYSGIGSLNVGNTCAGDGSFVGGGFLNQAQSFGSSILGGYTNIANGTYSVVLGSSFGTTRTIQGNTVIPASNNPMNISSVGVCQTAVLVLARQTTDATATVLASNSSAASGNNQVILPNNSAYYFKGSVTAINQFVLTTTGASGAAGTATLTFATQAVAPYIVGQSIVVAGVTPAGYNGTQIVTACTTSSVSYTNATTAAQTVAGTITGSSYCAAWDFSGQIMRSSSAAGTRLVGTPQLNRVAADANASTWTIALTADTTNGGLAVTVTGVAATTIRWVAKIETTEVTY